jgi:HK97 family phage major capsid protein
MALKVLMLRKKLNDAKRALEDLRAKDAEFESREAEITQSIEEAQTDEERSAVDEAVDAFEAEKADHEEQKGQLERKVEELENELAAEEAAQATDPVEEPEEKREEIKMIDKRDINSVVTDERVKDFLTEVRTAIKEKRAITNVGLTIPEVMLGLLRENIGEYSKLYKHVDVRRVGGDGRLVIMGAIPEAIWTDCCGNLNEMSLGFNDLEVGCWKVGGYMAICNASLEDSDVDLAGEIVRALGKGIGIALDKAILFGTGNHMPQGVVTRLVQTTQPTSYPATARTWANLSTANVKTHATTVTGVNLFKAIIEDAGAASNKYAAGEAVWTMNEKTYAALTAESVGLTAEGKLATAMNGQMPVIGGPIEKLSFIPDNLIIGGYFEDYLLAERAGQKFATSEHVRFLNDQTVIKGTARYDGAPSIAEAFVAVGIKGVVPATVATTVTFATDTANT